MGEGFEEMIASVPVKRVASPQKIAAAAVYLASDDADHIQATARHLDGGRRQQGERSAPGWIRTSDLRIRSGRFAGLFSCIRRVYLL